MTKLLFVGQGALQVLLVILAFAMTPVMLLATPFVEKRRLRLHVTQRPAESCVDVGAGDVEGDIFRSEAAVTDEPEHHDPTEITIHYIIHTNEFVLGTVSNTASYLRLWALSLAHAQLSEVFFRFGIVQVITMDTAGVMLFVGSGAWLGATLGVLLGMEALSAFLHSLRLHWVEFQNKFYLGDGTAFSPLDLVLLPTIDV